MLRRRKQRATRENDAHTIALIWQRWRGVAMAVAVLSAAVGAGVSGYRYVTAPDTLPFNRLVVEGEFINVAQQQVRAAVEPLLKGGFFVADLLSVKEAVLALPWVQWVALEREWPDTLRVKVIEQRAVAQWDDVGLLNERGELFKPEARTFPAGLPRLSGPEGMHKQVADRYRELANQLVMINLHVKELRLDERRAWTATLDNQLTLALGRSMDRARLQRFIRAYPRALARRIDQVQRLDLRYPNGFAVAWKPQVVEPHG